MMFFNSKNGYCEIIFKSQEVDITILVPQLMLCKGPF